MTDVTFTAAAATLFRVSVLPAPSLLATTLQRDGLPPQAGFDKARDAGSVLVLHPGLYLVERLSHGDAVARGGPYALAANAALAGSTYAITASHWPTEVVLANRPVPCDTYLRRVRHADNPSLAPPSSHAPFPLTSVETLAMWDGALMPALTHAIAEEATIGAARDERTRGPRRRRGRLLRRPARGGAAPADAAPGPVPNRRCQ